VRGARLDCAHGVSFYKEKKNNMISLFTRKTSLTPELLTLPAFCVPADVSDTLRTKREAQLEWMRTQGVNYLLGSPVMRSDHSRFAVSTAQVRRVA